MPRTTPSLLAPSLAPTGLAPRGSVPQGTTRAWPSVLSYSFPEEREEPAPEPPSLAAKLAAADAAAQAQSPAPVAHETASCPAEERHAIEVTVVDDLERPLAGAYVELRKSDTEVVIGKTDVTGWLRFDGLEAGRYSLGMAGLDRDAWTALASETLPEERATSRGDATWKAPAALPTASTHTALQGEGLSELAARHGLHPDTLWSANPELQEQRHHRNVLAPGDTVKIPASTPRHQPAGVGEHHRLQRLGVVEALQLRFLDAEGKPRAGVAYLLTLHLPKGEELREGKTDGSGHVDEAVPPDLDEVTLQLVQDDVHELYRFAVNHLDPVEEISGAQARLLSLGHAQDPEEQGELGPYTVRTLRDFQRQAELEPTGQLDDATLAKLEELHLS